MWELLRLFGLVARAGSFSAASPASGLSAVSLARRIEALEAELGVPLFLRGRGGVTLTEAGQRLLARLEGPLAAMAEAEADLRRMTGAGAGAPVRVSATEPIIAEVLAPALPALLAIDPRLTVELRVADGVVSLTRHEADIALRLARPEGNSLLVRRIARLRMGLYRHPGSDSTEVIGYDDKYGQIAEVVWLRAAGLQPRVTTSSTRALLQAVRAGAGMAVLPEFLALPGLEPVPGHSSTPPRDLWMLAHRDVARRPEVRQVMRWIVGAFRAAR